MIEFMKRIVEMGKDKGDGKTNAELLQTAIYSVKDDKGDFDIEKGAAFVGLYSWKEAKLGDVIKQMKQIYTQNPQNDKENTPEDLDSVIEHAIIQERREKAQPLAQQLNSYKSSRGKQIWNATVRDDGLIKIKGLCGFTFYPNEYGCDSDEAFELIGEIIADVSFEYCKNLKSTGSVELIDGYVYGSSNIPNFNRSIVKDQRGIGIRS